MMNFRIGKKFQSKPKNKLGLDMGSSSIKLLEIEVNNDKFLLSRIGFKKVSGTSHDILAGAVKSLIEESNIVSKEVNISVTGPSSIVRFVSMPKMRDEELKSAIKFEAEKYIPFAINDCIVDFQVLKKNDKEGKLDVLLVAVKKELVLNRIAIAEGCGLGVGVVDVDSFAVTNSFLKNFGQLLSDKTAALLNIGSALTNVSIVRDGALCFSRDVSIGGADFSAEISKSLNVDLALAEEIKISPGDKLEDIIRFTKTAVNNLLDEMKLSFSYYENQSGRGIDEIYISGGAAELPGLGAAFQEAFESKPFLWDPLKFLDASGLSANKELAGNMSRSFAVAAGLAIR